MAEHITSIKTYVLVYIALMALLVLTVWLAFLPLGKFEALPAYLIGALKAILVITFFMEVRVQPKIVRLLACIGFVWLGVMIILSMNDYMARGSSANDEVLRTDQPTNQRPSHISLKTAKRLGQ